MSLDSRIPLLLLSDSPSGTTGLGRITRELALRVHSDLGDWFRVGCLGHGGYKHSRTLPFEQFKIERIDNWAILDLPEVWSRFAGTERGVLMTICNGTWLEWLTNPSLVRDEPLRNFLRNRPFDLWGYFPVDGVSINDQLPLSEAETITKFDRVLAYTAWAAGIIERSTPLRDVNNLPHGIDRKVWQPQSREQARIEFLTKVVGHPVGTPPLRDPLLLMGCVATNSARKDWPLAIKTLHRLLRLNPDSALWIHTHKAQAYWDILGICRALEVEKNVVLTEGSLTDEQMATGYAACNVTLGIGSGEGFGYPLFESLAMGVPVVHGWYAGAVEYIPDEEMLDYAVGWHDDGYHCMQRPIFNPQNWAERVVRLAFKYDYCREDPEKVRLPETLWWDELWPRWQKWFEQGAGEFKHAG